MSDSIGGTGTYTEGRFRFEFPGCVVSRPEKKKRPCRSRQVDFVVERNGHRVVFVEVKDPSDPEATEDRRKLFAKKMKNNELVNNVLVPQCRDTFMALYLMGREWERIDYVVVLNLEAIPKAEAYLLALKERLETRLRQELDERWERQYLENCIVLQPQDWARHFNWATCTLVEEGAA
ncbi:hypothetical protein IIA79_01415 [bacterium]|nr:hypothetical protein [bacterium]